MQDNLKSVTADSVINTLLSLIELRMPKSMDHARRMSTLSVKIAEALMLQDDEVEDIRLAGLLHDAGKVFLSDSILSFKSISLQGAELFSYIKHPSHGYALLKDMPGMGRVAQYVKSHHERHDGKGYPDGLKEDEISVGAKILALVEYFEEIRSGHLSLTRISDEKAVSLIKSESEKMFDPTIVDAFIFIAGEQGSLLQEIEGFKAPNIRTPIPR